MVLKRYILSLLLFFMVSCTPASKPVVNESRIYPDFISYLVYQRDHLKLATDFKGFDENMKPLSKKDFLQKASAGGYLPLRLQSTDSTYHFKLSPLPSTVDADIAFAVKQNATTHLIYYGMEGRKLSDFNFTDLSGMTYNAENTKRKIVLMNFWFMGSTPSVDQFPELNATVAKYRDRKDMVFISVAFDKAPELREFLKTYPLNYAVVPDQQSYLANEFKVQGYPTHVLINKEGIIVKVVSDFKDLTAFLQQQIRE